MEQCENCGRLIGNLETPHLYNEHIVCATCAQVLTSAPPAPTLPAPTPPAPPAEVIVFQREGVVVSNTHVALHGRQIPLGHILSVKTERRSFSIARDIYLRDTLTQRHKISFTSPTDAKDFIAALSQVKGSLTVEGDEQAGVFVWW
jgi:hypothetical protein